MSFLRPGAVAAILRWRETAIGAGAALLGSWWLATGIGTLRWVGVAVLVGGVAILREGLARARRPGDGTGAGMVEVDERRITYFSGTGGGAVSLDGLARVHVVAGGPGSAAGGPAWVFTPAEGEPLTIPGDALGAAQIVDAVAALPGVSHEHVLDVLRRRDGGHHTIWLPTDGTDRRRLH